MADLDALRAPLHALPDPLPVPTPPAGTRFDAVLAPPGSKSLTNRALLLAALADGPSLVRQPLVGADDTERMLAALRELGATIERHPAGAWIVIRGRAGRLRGDRTLFLNNAGTATRFLTAAALVADAPVVVDGNPRMRERPIGELVALLRALGAEVEELGTPGHVPLRVHPLAGPPPAQPIEVPTTMSSQFVSALLLVAPFLAGDLALRCVGPVTSASYVEMTIGLLRQLGAVVKRDDDVIAVAATGLGAFEYDVEPDASGATYLWGAAALLPGSRCRVPGLHFTALQHDARFPMVLRQMGCRAGYDDNGATITGPAGLVGVDVDLELMPDTAMTLAAVACFADGPTRIGGLRTLRVKETDRIAALETELGKLGAEVTATNDKLRITPPAIHGDEPVELDTYDDHRMAMALALVGLRRPNVLVRDPACVAKTYPGYWSDLAELLASTGIGSGAR